MRLARLPTNPRARPGGNIREERYEKLVAMADRMKAHFEADPEDKTDDREVGRRLLYALEEVLKDVWGHKSLYSPHVDADLAVSFLFSPRLSSALLPANCSKN